MEGIWGKNNKSFWSALLKGSPLLEAKMHLVSIQCWKVNSNTSHVQVCWLMKKKKNTNVQRWNSKQNAHARTCRHSHVNFSERQSTWHVGICPWCWNDAQGSVVSWLNTVWRPAHFCHLHSNDQKFIFLTIKPWSDTNCNCISIYKKITYGMHINKCLWLFYMCTYNIRNMNVQICRTNHECRSCLHRFHPGNMFPQYRNNWFSASSCSRPLKLCACD